MAYFVARLTMKDEEKSAQYQAQHTEYLTNLMNEGKVVAAGPFTDGSGGMVLYEAASFDEAKCLVEGDPFVSEGARAYELVEWSIKNTIKAE